MIRAAVLGSPISHSRSPILHNAAYAKLGIEGEYSALEIDEASISQFLRTAHQEEWTGFSLTMPLKDISTDEKIWSDAGLTVSVDTEAAQISSINTLLKTERGYRALSTDLLAFQRLLKPLIASDSCVTLLGGGGTARAAIGALQSLGLSSLTLYLRGAENSRHATKLKQCFPTISFSFHEYGSPLIGGELLINTTPRGSADIYSEANLYGSLFESLYNPWPTELAQRYLQVNQPVLSGHDLLVEQALDQIALMTGRVFDYEAMREYLLTL